MAAASARTSRLGLCGCSMRGKIAVVVAFSAGSIASGSSAGSLVPVASAEGEPLAASAGVAPLVELVASGGTVAASEVGGVAVPALAIPEPLTESGIVSTCTFDGDTYCYDCLCNYRNQTKQHKLSLG